MCANTFKIILIVFLDVMKKRLINFTVKIVWFNQYGLSGTLPQALIIICEECSLFSCQL